MAILKGLQLDESMLEEVSGGVKGFYKYHTVKAGETLSDIAKTYHTNTQRLAAINNHLIDDPEAIIPAGTKLVVSDNW